jgi:YgiT-type zinc finger domain-containing protein
MVRRLQGAEAESVKASLSKCLHCGSSDLEDRDVEKLVRGGDDVVALLVRATVCHHCGERYLPQEAIGAIERARRDLQHGEVGRFRAVGRFLTPQQDSRG